VQFAIGIPADHVFRGEQQDVDDTLGNLMTMSANRLVAASRRGS